MLDGRELWPVNGTAFRIVLLTSALSGGCSDVYESRYSNRDEAVRDGAIARGWIPDILPADALDIREVHDIDTNQTWCCFTTPGGVAQVRSRLEQAGAKQERFPWSPEIRAPAWWPETPPDERHSLREVDGSIVRIRMNVGTKKVCFSRGIA